MILAAVLQTAPAQTRSGPGSISRVDIIRSMAEAEPVWRAFENTSPFFTPYQRFDFLDTWSSNVGQDKGADPLVVVAYDACNRPLSLLPLAVKRESGARVARFMGGKHSTFNMPIWKREFAASVTTADLEMMTNAISGEPVDVLALTQQPKNWQGVQNPFTSFAHQPSTNTCPMMTMEPGCKPEERVSASARRRLRNKERKLQGLRGYRYFVATEDADINRLLNAFFFIKPQRMALSKLPNVFADDATKAFIRDACMAKVPGGDRAIQLHALECDDELISIFACVADGQRFSTMFNTYTVSDNARYSPGLILLRYMIDHYGERGYTSFDFGVGYDEYKTMFCKKDESIVDSFIPFTARGQFAALRMSSLTHAKRIVKQNPALTQVAHRLLGTFHK